MTLAERLVKEAADKCEHYDYHSSPPCEDCAAKAINAALDEAARVARNSEPEVWPFGMDTGHMWRLSAAKAIGDAIEALKTKETADASA